tara:strand:+ start:10526 stop:12019 length:1494 start_codon:yes stop_codon:yes gene_type:complete
MAELDNNILAVLEPAILPTEIELKSNGEEDGDSKQSKSVGGMIPYIDINGHQFRDGDIQNFSLTIGGIMPLLNITLRDTSGVFDAAQYPRDGDVVTVLINSKNQETFKSIHMDFNILSISSPPSSGETREPTYHIRGRIKVPGMYTEECKEYSEDTSLAHIEQIAQELELGLATNIDSTDDTQPRIQPYIKTLDFIKDVVKTSYVGEESFQKFYIDAYYYLNFIEVNKLINSKNVRTLEELQDSIMSTDRATTVDKGSDENDSDDTQTKLMLTNHPKHTNGGNYISKYSLQNNSNNISQKNGYKRVLQMYDDLESERLTEFDIQSFLSTNLRDGEGPLQGRTSENVEGRHLKHKYVGRMQDFLLEGNVHSNHKYSVLNNLQNIQELNKLKLTIELSQFNAQLYLFQKVPIMIYVTDGPKSDAIRKDEERLKQKGVQTSDNTFEKDKDDKETPHVVDEFISGHYIISSIEYTFRAGQNQLGQKLSLQRREWPLRSNDI